MPYPIVTKDGIRIENIPDNVDKNDQSLKSQVAAMRAAGVKSARFGEAAPAQPSDQPEAAAVPAAQGQGPDIATRVAESPITTGIAQAGGTLARGALALPAFATEALQQGWNLIAPDGMQISPEMMATQDLRALTSRAGTTAGGEYVESAMSALTPVGAGRAVAAGLTGMASAVGRELASGPTAQVAGAMGATAGMEAASDMPASEQLGAAILGGLAGGRAASRVDVQPRATSLPGEVAAAESAGIPVMTSDVAPPTTASGKWLQSVIEKIPITGTGAARAEQRAAREEAVGKFVDMYGADDLSKLPADVMADITKKRADDLVRFSQMKKEVIGRLSADAVPVANATKAIDDEIAALSKNADTKEVAQVIADLKAFRDNIRKKDLSSIEVQRSLLGKKYADPSLVGARELAERSFSKIYGPLNEDMGAFIKTNGQPADFTKWKIANNRLSSMSDELKVDALRNVLNRGVDNPEAVIPFLTSNKKSVIDSAYVALTQEGKSRARSLIVAEAYRRSKGQPDAFVRELDKFKVSTDRFFKGADARLLDGIKRGIEITNRATTATANPATGQQAVIPLAADFVLNVFGVPTLATAATLGAGAAGRGYESKAVRNLVMKLPTVKKGSVEEQEIIKRLISAQSATQAQSENK